MVVSISRSSQCKAAESENLLQPQHDDAPRKGRLNELRRKGLGPSLSTRWAGPYVPERKGADEVRKGKREAGRPQNYSSSLWLIEVCHPIRLLRNTKILCPSLVACLGFLPNVGIRRLSRFFLDISFSDSGIPLFPKKLHTLSSREVQSLKGGSPDMDKDKMQSLVVHGMEPPWKE